MASDLAMTTAAVLGVALVGAAGGLAWAYLEPIDTPGSRDALADDYTGTRVFFVEQETRMATTDHDLPADGEIVFDPLRVPLANVTSVTITLHANVEGTALNDQYDVHVRTPDGAQESGVWSGPLINTDGYRGSAIIIPDWQRAPNPPEAVYKTRDSEQALRWSAENNTRTGSKGDWQAELTLSTPSAPGRDGNVSLSYSFTHYEALAVLVNENEESPPTCPDAPSEEHEPATDCPPPANATQDAQRGQNTLIAKGTPRTFITGVGLARSVDRDPGPHGPL